MELNYSSSPKNISFWNCNLLEQICVVWEGHKWTHGKFISILAILIKLQFIMIDFHNKIEKVKTRYFVLTAVITLKISI